MRDSTLILNDAPAGFAIQRAFIEKTGITNPLRATYTTYANN